ncbi:uncharacterized protein K460DRAFT_360161 [Cucurbitaria berberidis CBS 394.84]|uniref:Uncharacterized protein n=1 Tax=Cucurbitaria berberidis CBS 394.84 TaxID=1168544 RepID=A0A9P4G7S2_9PLEO|nr:uncharacterized protein K460DRAFT_360161 [Cucurbitaria berberidis CBS 394.84]KAF1840491.1 hypothetical protein K460DRAFT_360161 [Cucurbitaria berberidis CBS 394.84]
MSGFTTTALRGNTPNTFFCTPFDGEIAPEPTAPSRHPNYPNYEPLRRRKYSDTKYDVRSTYPKGHALRAPYRVSKHSTERRSRPSSDSFGSSRNPSVTNIRSESSYPSDEARCFIPIDNSEEETKRTFLHAVTEQFRALRDFFTVNNTDIEEEQDRLAWNDRELMLVAASAYKQLWWELKMRTVRQGKRRATKTLRSAPRWACTKAVDTTLALYEITGNLAGRLGQYIASRKIMGNGWHVVGRKVMRPARTFMLFGLAVNLSVDAVKTCFSFTPLLHCKDRPVSKIRHYQAMLPKLKDTTARFAGHFELEACSSKGFTGWQGGVPTPR